ncbi:type II toxin-antitoxin system VapC family toxin [Salinibacter ruber]|jgi:predicted nucleic acid-binding protein|uniref:type II toxin-antitoxin system VapC family toxin n=1 Tax=Salinibacter ruber TaxID=146919 RepID=UPI0021692117|nr:PIN domain-containing protein [Salinibacter ruber]MCS4134681.1 putative nucleic acid-binding protein [Salinibacter ruber]
MRPVFLDTGYVIALEAADDQHHEPAVSHWREIGPEYTSIVTTTYVFDECVTFFNGRGHHAKAVEIGWRLRKSPRIEVVPETRTLLEAAWTRFRDRPDKRYSLTDCFSFVLMDRRGLDHALAFDDHFRQAGFQCLPMEGP